MHSSSSQSIRAHLANGLAWPSPSPPLARFIRTGRPDEWTANRGLPRTLDEYAIRCEAADASAPPLIMSFFAPHGMYPIAETSPIDGVAWALCRLAYRTEPIYESLPLAVRALVAVPRTLAEERMAPPHARLSQIRTVPIGHTPRGARVLLHAKGTAHPVPSDGLRVYHDSPDGAPPVGPENLFTLLSSVARGGSAHSCTLALLAGVSPTDLALKLEREGVVPDSHLTGLTMMEYLAYARR